MSTAIDAREQMRVMYPGYSYDTMILRDPAGRVVPRDSDHVDVNRLADAARHEAHVDAYRASQAAYDAAHKPVAAPDNGESDAPFDPADDPRMRLPVAVHAVSEISKAIVRAAPAERRQSLWNGLNTRLEQAQENSADRMPWNDSATVQHITKLAALRVITRSIDDLIPETETRARLLGIAARKRPGWWTAHRPPPRGGLRAGCAVPWCSAPGRAARKNSSRRGPVRCTTAGAASSGPTRRGRS